MKYTVKSFESTHKKVLFDILPTNHAAYFEHVDHTSATTKKYIRKGISSNLALSQAVSSFNTKNKYGIKESTKRIEPTQSSYDGRYEWLVYLIVVDAAGNYAVAPELNQIGWFYYWRYELPPNGPNPTWSASRIHQWAKDQYTPPPRQLEFRTTVLTTPIDYVYDAFGVELTAKKEMDVDLRLSDVNNLFDEINDAAIVGADVFYNALQSSSKEYGMFKVPANSVVVPCFHSKDLATSMCFDGTAMITNDGAVGLLRGGNEYYVSYHVANKDGTAIPKSALVILMKAAEVNEGDDLKMEPIEIIYNFALTFGVKTTAAASTMTTYEAKAHPCHLLLNANLHFKSTMWKVLYNTSSDKGLVLISDFLTTTQRTLSISQSGSSSFELYDMRDKTFPRLAHEQNPPKADDGTAFGLLIKFAWPGLGLTAHEMPPSQRVATIYDYLTKMIRNVPVPDTYDAADFDAAKTETTDRIWPNTLTIIDRIRADDSVVYFCDQHDFINQRDFLTTSTATKIYIVENEAGDGAVALHKAFSAAIRDVHKYNDLLKYKWCYVLPADVIYEENAVIVADPLADGADYAAAASKYPTSCERMYILPAKTFVVGSRADDVQNDFMWDKRYYKRSMTDPNQMIITAKGTSVVTKPVGFPGAEFSNITISNNLTMSVINARSTVPL